MRSEIGILIEFSHPSIAHHKIFLKTPSMERWSIGSRLILVAGVAFGATSLIAQVAYLSTACTGPPMLRGFPMLEYSAWFAMCAAAAGASRWRTMVGGMAAASVAFALYGIGDIVREAPGTSAAIAGVVLSCAGHLAHACSAMRLPFVAGFHVIDIGRLRGRWTLAASVASVLVSGSVAIAIAASRSGRWEALGAVVRVIVSGLIPAAGIVCSGGMIGASYLVGAHLVQASIAASGSAAIAIYWVGCAFLAFVPSWFIFGAASNRSAADSAYSMTEAPLN